MRRLAWFLCVPVVAGCAGKQPATLQSDPQAAYEARAAVLANWDVWGLSARLGIAGDSEGGSGRLEWRTSPNESVLQFRGTLGRGSWRVRVANGVALLTRSDGSTARGGDVEALVRDELGWHVPVDALQWWVRGLASPASDHRLKIDERGLASGLQQDEWEVAFDRYREFQGQMLPERIEAVHGDYRIRLAIGSWQRGRADGV